MSMCGGLALLIFPVGPVRVHVDGGRGCWVMLVRDVKVSSLYMSILHFVFTSYTSGATYTVHVIQSYFSPLYQDSSPLPSNPPPALPPILFDLGLHLCGLLCGNLCEKGLLLLFGIWLGKVVKEAIPAA